MNKPQNNAGRDKDTTTYNLIYSIQLFCITTTATILMTTKNDSNALLASSSPSCSAGPQALIRRRVVRMRALVLLPSRDLAMQVHSVFKKYARGTGLRVGLAIGQTNFLEEQLALVGPVALAGDTCLHGTDTAVVASAAAVVVVADFVICRSCGCHCYRGVIVSLVCRCLFALVLLLSMMSVVSMTLMLSLSLILPLLRAIMMVVVAAVPSMHSPPRPPVVCAAGLLCSKHEPGSPRNLSSHRACLQPLT